MVEINHRRATNFARRIFIPADRGGYDLGAGCRINPLILCNISAMSARASRQRRRGGEEERGETGWKDRDSAKGVATGR